MIKISMTKIATVLVATILTVAFIDIISKKKENFTATGWVENRPPNWYMVPKYDPRQWLVREYQDKIQPECVTYSIADKYGGLDNLNYLSSAYRFWRM